MHFSTYTKSHIHACPENPKVAVQICHCELVPPRGACKSRTQLYQL